MPTTTNFGWTTPADTDLVKDGASAIRTLANGIDTSFLDLKGGTTGQVLSKNSNTDLDFTWVAQDDANAIQNAIVDAKGDLITATANDTPARLGVGTNGQILMADSTTATGLKWATPASGGKVLQVVSATYSTSTTIASTSFTDTGLTATITPTASTSSVLVLVSQATFIERSTGQQGAGLQLVRGATNLISTNSEQFYIYTGDPSYSAMGAWQSINWLDSPATTSSTTYKVQLRAASTLNTGRVIAQQYSIPSTIILMEIGA